MRHHRVAAAKRKSGRREAQGMEWIDADVTRVSGSCPLPADADMRDVLSAAHACGFEE